jgi:hypothetical protein
MNIAIQRLIFISIACLSLAYGNAARSDTLFSDTFNSGASSAWGNEVGNWTAAGGVYRAQNPSNFPNSYSFVTTSPNLTDFSVSVVVVSGRDGGVWLRANSAPTTIGVAGVLLIFLNDQLHNNALFWHDVGNQYGPELNQVTNLPLGNFLLRIDVIGNVYSAYINGSSTPATTYVSNNFTSGYVGLYDHDIFDGGLQAFDNFSLTAPNPVPLPGALPLFATGLGALGILGWRRKKKAVQIQKVAIDGSL